MLKFHTQTSFQTVAFLVQSFTGSSTNRWHPHLLHFLKPITTCEYSLVPSGCPGFCNFPIKEPYPQIVDSVDFLRKKTGLLGTIRFSLPELKCAIPVHKYAKMRWRPGLCPGPRCMGSSPILNPLGASILAPSALSFYGPNVKSWPRPFPNPEPRYA